MVFNAFLRSRNQKQDGKRVILPEYIRFRDDIKLTALLDTFGCLFPCVVLLFTKKYMLPCLVYFSTQNIIFVNIVCCLQSSNGLPCIWGSGIVQGLLVNAGSHISPAVSLFVCCCNTTRTMTVRNVSGKMLFVARKSPDASCSKSTYNRGVSRG